MKRLRQLMSLLLILSLCTCLLPARFAGAVYAEGESNRVYLTPKLGDGASLDEDVLDDLYVVGTLSDDKKVFTYTETRTLQFTVTLESGWSYNATYSQIFKGDEQHVTVTGDESSVTVTYEAVAGQSIAFTSLSTLGLYTSAEELPKMYLTIDGSWDSVTKTEWVDAEINLQLGTKAYASGNYIGNCQVKGRGNLSWSKDPKPYSINFEKKTSLLDFPEIKKYCIVTNSIDGSCLRNIVTYQTYQNLDGIDYVVHSELVRVYFNGDEAGIYTLSERVRLSKNQINDEAATPENVSGAYLIEKTVSGKGNDDEWISAPYHGHTDDYEQLSFCDPDEVNDEMKQYVHDAFFTMHDAIMSDSETAYQDYLDTDSWVDFLILEEVAKNNDGELKTSTFFYLPGGSSVVYFTSPWDFDIAYNNYGDGNNNFSEQSYPDGTTWSVSDSTNVSNPQGWITITDNCIWFKTLYNRKPAFKRAVQEKYTEYRYTVLQDLYNNTYKYAAYLGDSGDADEIQVLLDWLDDRLAWLDTQWLLDDYDAPAYGISVTSYGDVLVTSSDGDNASAAVGESKVLSFKPADGFLLQQVIFNGRDVTDELVGNCYTTPYLTGDCEIIVRLTSGSLTFSGLITGHGETIDGFTVTLSQDGAVKYSVLSAGDTYCFTDVKSGTYTLTIGKSGYVPDVNTVELYVSSSTKTNVLFRKGDCTLDGEIGAEDLSLLAGHLARTEKIAKKKARGAVMLTGDELCAADVTLLCRYLAGSVKTLD